MEITQEQNLMVVGLLVLGRQYEQSCLSVIKSLREILKEEEDFGHCADAIYSNYSADYLLKKLRIKVKK